MHIKNLEQWLAYSFGFIYIFKHLTYTFYLFVCFHCRQQSGVAKAANVSVTGIRGEKVLRQEINN